MSEPDVRTREELIASSGSRAVLHGRYEARPRPVRGTVPPSGPADRAVVVLDDGVAVWLEPLDDPSSVRPATERERFDGAAVRALGVVHEVMPAAGQSPLAPCLTGVEGVEADA